MARNSEKTQTQLNRYLQAKKAEESKGKYSFDTKKRPHLASSVTSLEEAEYWLRSIISDFKHNLSKITFQRSLNNEEIRDLNDRLNKILRIKKYWEKQVKTLGGKDYSKKPTTTITNYNNNNNTNANNDNDIVEDDSIIDESTGYIYFGAAKNLPGVKQLYNKQNKAKNAENNTENKNYQINNLNKRALLNRVANSDYLAEPEQKAKELAAIEQDYMKNKQKKQKINHNGSDNDNDEDDPEDDNQANNTENKTIDAEDTKAMIESEDYKYYGNLATITSKSIQFPFQLPTKEQIEAEIVQQERNQLLAQYTT